MPSPLLPDELKALIPKAGDPVCGKLTTGITNWMQRVSDHFAWMLKKNGDLSVAFISDLCALDCMCNGSNPGDPGVPCPEIVLTGTVTPDDTILNVSFNGPGMLAGYNFNLFRRTSDLDPWVSITSGVTTGSVVSYQDTGLVNATVYYYKLQVQKAGCSVYEGFAQGAPSGCFDILPVVQGGADPGAPLNLSWTLLEANNKFLPLETLVSLYVSTDPNSIGSLYNPETILNNFGVGCDVPPIIKRCISVDAINPLQIYYFTFKVKYKAGCPEKTVVVSARPYPNPIAAPGIVVTGQNIILSTYPQFGNDIVRYEIWRQPIGNHVAEGTGFTPWRSFNQTASSQMVIPISVQEWPATEIIGNTYKRAIYAIYAVAIGPVNNRSDNSAPWTFSLPRL